MGLRMYKLGTHKIGGWDGVGVRAGMVACELAAVWWSIRLSFPQGQATEVFYALSTLSLPGYLENWQIDSSLREHWKLCNAHETKLQYSLLSISLLELIYLPLVQKSSKIRSRAAKKSESLRVLK
jgi:hypothetical protein